MRGSMLYDVSSLVSISAFLSKIFPHNWFSAILPVRAQHTPHNRQSLYPFVKFIKVQSNRFSKMRTTNVGLSRFW